MIILKSLIYARTLLILMSFASASIAHAAASSSDYTPESSTVALIDASKRGELQHVKDLIAQGAKPDARDVNGSMAIHHAAEEGMTHIVEHFLVTERMHPDVRGWNNGTPLHWAARRGHCTLIAYLPSHNAMKDAQGNDGRTPLVEAAAHNHPEAVELLLKHNADPRLKIIGGISPFLAACTKGHILPAKLLMAAYDAKDDVDDSGMSALHIAASNGHADLIDLLVLNNFALEAQTHDDGAMPLHWACSANKLEAAQRLLSYQKNVEVKTYEGFTPLHVACVKEYDEMIRWLILQQADIFSKNKYGITPMHLLIASAGRTKNGALLRFVADILDPKEETR